MGLRRRSLIGVLALVVVTAAAAFALGRATGDDTRRSSSTSPTAAPAAKRPAAKTYLFSQAAGGGSLTGPDAQHLTLRLTDVNDWVTRFTERPAREAQTVDIRDFIARWKARFEGSPPNAVLSYRVDGDPRPREIVLELRAPRYDAASETLTYSARRIVESADRLVGTEHHRKAVDYPLPRTFSSASVFIDDSGDPLSVTVTDISAQNNGLSSSDYYFKWRADLSQCAGYGSVVQGDSLQFALYYDSFDDGSCFFKPTYARFEVYAYQPDGSLTDIGTMTFDSLGHLVSSSGVEAAPCGGVEGDGTVHLLGAGDQGCRDDDND